MTAFNHPHGTPPSILGGASAVILRDHVKTRGRGAIMEPFIQVQVSVGSDVLGKVMKDLVEHGGAIIDLAESNSLLEDESSAPYGQEGVYIPPRWLSPSTMSSTEKDNHFILMKRHVCAVAPLSQMLDYSTRLRALSGGHGHFDMAPAGFRTVGEEREVEILKEIGRL